MKISSKFTITTLAIALVYFIPTTSAINNTPTTIDRHLPHPQMIAHALGVIDGIRYSNSYEALEKSYQNGFRFFETDIELTADNKLVLLHDWDGVIQDLYGAPPKIYTLDEFKKLKIREKYTPLTLDNLLVWIKKHPDTYFITDTKRKNLVILNKLYQQSGELSAHFIPQIYNFEEYDTVKKLGYFDIILTLYTRDYKAPALVNFAQQHKLWAITMSTDRIKTYPNLPAELTTVNIFTYSHLVNSQEQMTNLQKQKIGGVYTSDLIPNSD
ncbi:MAG: hypothetical protein UR53_C0002G0044 [Candidatus Magasanikbacteria bacterium GW2011_GWC2_34_16]|uniref:GP-PDE domain-containing protein n=2 Tax=Candidatus Magasanikiibacteriota TaxID=1752731 RepID=A0A0G0KKW9_9BACT|nr:MAG: hypothetical protein UR53_C0002G0044 [Candidatus Magasanikbacteria bacterium GW2011_GWC2_34_16]KKQ41231.1 MAG: hypothetical protein US58_C0003G0014 [Candidatus Magasanikbacteria bacterium GW2011_GWA2_37_8]